MYGWLANTGSAIAEIQGHTTREWPIIIGRCIADGIDWTHWQCVFGISVSINYNAHGMQTNDDQLFGPHFCGKLSSSIRERFQFSHPFLNVFRYVGFYWRSAEPNTKYLFHDLCAASLPLASTVHSFCLSPRFRTIGNLISIFYWIRP